MEETLLTQNNKHKTSSKLVGLPVYIFFVMIPTIGNFAEMIRFGIIKIKDKA